jgi:RimJ/RimL family protein N-acetyltransferase
MQIDISILLKKCKPGLFIIPERNMIFIETKSLLLTKLTPEDTPDFYRLCNQPYILKWMNDWEMDYDTTAGLVKCFICGYDINDPEKHPYILALRLKSANRFIGIVGFGTKEELGGETEIAYFIDEAYSNKGYMSEAVKAAIDYYFKLTNKDYISALVDENNIPSKKILMKNGFTFYNVNNSDGIMKSHYRLYKKNIESI